MSDPPFSPDADPDARSSLPPAGEDYLWDPTAPVDAELAELEASLAGLAYRGSLPPLPAQLPPHPAGVNRTAVLAGLLAASGLLAAGVAFWSPRSAPRPSWNLVALDRSGALPGRLVQGEWLDTGSGRYRVQVADIGQIEVEPQSRVRLVETGPEAHRLELARGALHAVVTAPPRLFVVDTPAAKAVDLGCAYDLEVDEQGEGLLEVSLGAVSLEGAHAVYVPAGARCTTWPAGGIGVPVFVDAEPLFLASLTACDRLLAEGIWSDASPELEAQRPVFAKHLECALPLARVEDSLTLFHLLPRLPRGLRPALVDRLRDLAPLPSEVDAAAVLELEPAALELWRESMAWCWGW